MPRLVYQPAFPLSQYVDLMWHRASSGPSASRQRIYPDGAMVLAIALQQPTLSFFLGTARHTIPVPLLAGPYSRSFDTDPSPSAVIAIRFRPGAARAFFPIAAHELHNTDIALRQLYPAEADRFLNDVCSATGEHAQLQAVEHYLIRKLAHATPIHPAVRHAVRQLSREGTVQSIRKIQLDTGLSHTRFIQLFREHVGLTPKLFCRVRRFRSVLHRIDQGLPVHWAVLAADCGYFDQAHLIHDFRAFAELTPLAYTRAMPGSAA